MSSLKPGETNQSQNSINQNWNNPIGRNHKPHSLFLIVLIKLFNQNSVLMYAWFRLKSIERERGESRERETPCVEDGLEKKKKKASKKLRTLVVQSFNARTFTFQKVRPRNGSALHSFNLESHGLVHKNPCWFTSSRRCTRLKWLKIRRESRPYRIVHAFLW